MNGKIDISGVTLTTQRLILRPWREEDWPDLYEYARVDGVGQMAGWLPHKDSMESRAVLKMFIRGRNVLALEYQGKVIGSLGIELYNEEHYPELASRIGREIGYVLSRDYWGRGLMTEAVREVNRYLFDTVGLDFVLVAHFIHNDRSRRVIEKCGFQYIKDSVFKTQFDIVEPSRDYILYRKAWKRMDRRNHWDWAQRKPCFLNILKKGK